MMPIDFPDIQKHFIVTFGGTSHFAHSRCAPPFEIFGAGHSYGRTEEPWGKWIHEGRDGAPQVRMVGARKK